MAEFVQLKLEESVDELQELTNLAIFMPDELAMIIKRRREFEYKLRRKQKSSDDYLRYAEYEKTLLELIELRRKKMHYVNIFCHKKVSDNSRARVDLVLEKKFEKWSLPESQAERNIVNRIHGLYRECIKRYPQALEIWKERLSFAKSRVLALNKIDKYLKYRLGSNRSKEVSFVVKKYRTKLVKNGKRLERAENRVSSIYSELMNLHSNQVWVWTGAANWEFQTDYTQISKVRSLLRRALNKFHVTEINESQHQLNDLRDLWLTYIAIEVSYFNKLESRNEILTLNPDQRNNNHIDMDEDNCSKLKVIKVIFRHATETLVNHFPSVYLKIFECFTSNTKLFQNMASYFLDEYDSISEHTTKFKWNKIIASSYLFKKFGTELIYLQKLEPFNYESLKYLNQKISESSSEQSIALNYLIKLISIIKDFTNFGNCFTNPEAMSTNESAYLNLLLDTLNLLHAKLVPFVQQKDFDGDRGEVLKAWQGFVETLVAILDLCENRYIPTSGDDSYEDVFMNCLNILSQTLNLLIPWCPAEPFFWKIELMRLTRFLSYKTKNITDVNVWVSTFDKAITKVPERNSQELWLIILSEISKLSVELSFSSEADSFEPVDKILNNLVTRALSLNNANVILPIKTFLLGHWYGKEKLFGLQKFFNLCLKTRPYNSDMILRLIKYLYTFDDFSYCLPMIESCFNLAKREFGTQDPEVWIEYIKFAKLFSSQKDFASLKKFLPPNSEISRADGVDILYKEASKSLQSDKVNTFKTRYIEIKL